jgi:hypothetical protein
MKHCCYLACHIMKCNSSDSVYTLCCTLQAFPAGMSCRHSLQAVFKSCHTTRLDRTTCSRIKEQVSLTGYACAQSIASSTQQSCKCRIGLDNLLQATWSATAMTTAAEPHTMQAPTPLSPAGPLAHSQHHHHCCCPPHSCCCCSPAQLSACWQP